MRFEPMIRTLLATAALCLLAGAASGGELRLVATNVVRPDPEGLSRAVFADPGGRQRVVTPGEQVAGCTLLGVARKAVRLRCADGAVEVVLWAGLPTPAGARADGAPPEVAPASYQVSLPREAFAFALADRQRLVSQISLEPAVSDGRLYGYRIAWVREGGDFHRLGLRDGDVVVRLNGVRAGDPGTFMQALNGLRGSTSFTLDVEREGERVEYAYLLD
jgi:general secretion pathway protein C